MANEYQFGGDCRRFDCLGLFNLDITVKSLLDLGVSALSFRDPSFPGQDRSRWHLNAMQCTHCAVDAVYI